MQLTGDNCPKSPEERKKTVLILLERLINNTAVTDCFLWTCHLIWSFRAFSIREALNPTWRTLPSNHRSTSPSCTRRTVTNVLSSLPNLMAWLHSTLPDQVCYYLTGRPLPQTLPTMAARAAPRPTSRQKARQSLTLWPRSRPWSSSCPKCPHLNITKFSVLLKVSVCTKAKDLWIWLWTLTRAARIRSKQATLFFSEQ